MRTTIKNVNAAIKAAGSDFKLVRGNDGYFYFVSDKHMLYDESVYTTHITSMSVDEWVAELQKKIVEYNRWYPLRPIPELVIVTDEEIEELDDILRACRAKH